MNGPRWRTFNEDEKWLERFPSRPKPAPRHRCGRCSTPYGVSAIPCPNNQENQ